LLLLLYSLLLWLSVWALSAPALVKVTLLVRL
jgi:hypothetical protein